MVSNRFIADSLSVYSLKGVLSWYLSKGFSLLNSESACWLANRASFIIDTYMYCIYLYLHVSSVGI